MDFIVVNLASHVSVRICLKYFTASSYCLSSIRTNAKSRNDCGSSERKE